MSQKVNPRCCTFKLQWSTWTSRAHSFRQKNRQKWFSWNL